MKKGGESDGGGGRQKEEKWTVTINTYTQRKQKSTKGRGQRRYDLAACRYEHTNLSEREREREGFLLLSHISSMKYIRGPRHEGTIQYRSDNRRPLSISLSLPLNHFSGTKATVDHREMDVRFAWDKGCLDFFNIFGRLKKKVIVIQFIWDTWNDTWLFKGQNLNWLDSRS